MDAVSEYLFSHTGLAEQQDRRHSRGDASAFLDDRVHLRGAADDVSEGWSLVAGERQNSPV